MNRVFVYGSLMKGQPNHVRMGLAAAHFAGEAATADEFVMIDLGHFPGVARPAVGEKGVQIRGEVYEVTDAVFADLDRLEGHPRHYVREETKLADGTVAWMYVYPHRAPRFSNVSVDRKLVECGHWPTYRTERDTLRTFADLCAELGEREPKLLNRRLFKDTACGASITVYLPDGTAIRPGDAAWETLTRETTIRGFTIQAVIEGSDAVLTSEEFVLPVTVAQVDAWIDHMEAEADRLWNEANASEEA